jgi:hypothetical protein
MNDRPRYTPEEIDAMRERIVARLTLEALGDGGDEQIWPPSPGWDDWIEDEGETWGPEDDEDVCGQCNRRMENCRCPR